MPLNLILFICKWGTMIFKKGEKVTYEDYDGVSYAVIMYERKS